MPTERLRSRWARRPTASRRLWRRGATMVEFALVLPLFLALLMGIVEGAWYVLEVSAITNSARTASRWEIAAANYCAPGSPGCSSPTSPDCAQSPPLTSAGLVGAAQSTAGPFAGAISASTITTNAPVYQTAGDSTSPVIGCTVTITVPFQPLESLVHIGPSTLSSTFTAYIQ